MVQLVSTSFLHVLSLRHEGVTEIESDRRLPADSHPAATDRLFTSRRRQDHIECRYKISAYPRTGAPERGAGPRFALCALNVRVPERVRRGSTCSGMRSVWPRYPADTTAGQVRNLAWGRRGMAVLTSDPAAHQCPLQRAAARQARRRPMFGPGGNRSAAPGKQGLVALR